MTTEVTASNGKSAISSAPPPASAAEDLLDAWREALGEVLHQERRQWERERKLIEAQAHSVIAGLRAEVAELRSTTMDSINARLADVKRGEQGARGAQGERG